MIRKQDFAGYFVFEQCIKRGTIMNIIAFILKEVPSGWSSGLAGLASKHKLSPLCGFDSHK